MCAPFHSGIIGMTLHKASGVRVTSLQYVWYTDLFYLISDHLTGSTGQRLEVESALKSENCSRHSEILCIAEPQVKGK